MNLHYAKEFEKPITEGRKIHTLRNYKVEPGTILKHVVYPYTKGKRRIILTNTCVSCEELNIDYWPTSKKVIAKIGNTDLKLNDCNILAINDGFNTFEELFNYLFKGFDSRADQWGITIYIIHWTPKKYKAPF